MNKYIKTSKIFFDATDWMDSLISCSKFYGYFSGVTVCAVAVGDSINMAEINDIASSGCAFRATSFTRYDKIIEFAAAEGRGSRQQSPTLEPDFFSGIQF